ncbi:putative 2-oxoglutarate dehydrogenase E1 component DHKTD1-like protein [Dinothrombium tinctorium]|uniref:Putative 2-oxoglutarate dehydrogenase E1 component DHKTD1-like protein n=1 Tax=Dinothrombium tinctorium TaxID=1965070 RepID=A0A443RR07_9ACAR|nr:putative 2-oxoglutarate dehydrogenase E1 component DHKTD1-like protein [Dinothrombium tinctorium]
MINNQLNYSLIYSIIKEFREKGHYLASIDPLHLPHSKDIESKTFLLQNYENRFKENKTVFKTLGLLYNKKEECSVNEAITFLKKTYCGTVGVEFMHIDDIGEREWLASKWEQINCSDYLLPVHTKEKIAQMLLECQWFDNFVATKYPTVKRYACEGAESMIIFFDELFTHSCISHNVTDVIIGMPHRGRLNLLACLLKFPPNIMFRKMQGLSEFDLIKAPRIVGDVLSHLYKSIDLNLAEKKNIHVSLLPNPSHLEAINPVVCGKARGKAMTKNLYPYKQSNSNDKLPILPIQVHGDASFSGQGIVMECLEMSNVPHYSVGGSIHLVVNNQIGYTTPGYYNGRSSHYCSDVMKMIDAPCIHVNGDHPEDVLKVTRLAVDYRQKFGKDILIDLVCFRQWGHNELDDPTFTNPLMYKAIHSRERTVAEKYANEIFSQVEIDSIKQKFWTNLNQEFKKSSESKPSNENLKGVWSHIIHPSNEHITVWDTGYSSEQLIAIGRKSVEIPSGFNLHKTLNKSLVNDRLKRLSEQNQIDWATAEIFAFGSLLCEGHNVRISGQDVGRGTFNQRHAMIVDQESGEINIPLNDMFENQSAFLEVANSILSEEAVVGFEYGMSIDSPNNLIIWEAQFGDFFNGAQIMFDTFISAGELKWLLQSGLVILLPHGYDGAGPEHSSCRIERFLQMCDSSVKNVDSDMINWSVTHPSTPSQYFHLLRRQIVRNYRKPLIVASPKLLLRHPQCISNLSEFEEGTHFKPVIDDRLTAKTDAIQKVVFCSGKHYYALNAYRTEQNITDVAIVRIEELCPFPVKDISAVISKYANAKKIIWSQEEHENMGAWSFVNDRFKSHFGCELNYVGRAPLGTPAVGIGSLHKKEHQLVIAQTLEN